MRESQSSASSHGCAAIFLDRDGVLNRPTIRAGKPFAPTCIDELEILPDVVGACEALRGAGYLLVMVTNQPEIARGNVSAEAVHVMNNHLVEVLRLDLVKVCPHDDCHECGCRKPRPGLLLEAGVEKSIDLAASYMVGDRWRDIAAGRAAGCKTIFIDYQYDEARPPAPDFTTTTLLRAAEWILSTAS